MKAGTGVKVGISVNVGIMVALGIGVHVAGRVKGTSVDIDCDVRTELPQAERNRTINGKQGRSLFSKIRFTTSVGLNFQIRSGFVCRNMVVILKYSHPLDCAQKRPALTS